MREESGKADQEGLLEVLETGEDLETTIHLLRWGFQHPNRAGILMLYQNDKLIKETYSAVLKNARSMKGINKMVADFVIRKRFELID
ncbi:hypothetical protein KJ966_29735 [bacterium]|nr:hypothetical protein [bacterium]